MAEKIDFPEATNGGYPAKLEYPKSSARQATERMSATIDDVYDECGCGQDCMACPVTPARRAWWAEAVRQMDEMRALHAARAAQPPSPRKSFAPAAPPPDYQRAASLFGAEMATALERVDNGSSLYDALYPDGDPEWDAYEAECAARAAEREANAEFYRAEEAKALLAYQQRRIEEKVADESKMRLNRDQLKSGLKMVKNGRLCTRLYSCVGAAATGGAKPTTMHVSSECWSHERVTPEFASTWLERHGLDPKKGAEFLPAGMVAKLQADASAAHTESNPTLLTPHKCSFLHPGEAGWRAEWNANRLFKVAAAPPPAPHRLAAALGAPQQQSRFAAMAAPPVVATRAPWAAASAPRAPWADKTGGRPMSQSGGGHNDGWETQKPKRR